MSNPISLTSSDSGDLEFTHQLPRFFREEAAAGITSVLAEEVNDLITGVTVNATQVDENLINQIRLKQFRKRFTNELITLIHDEDFEYGIETRADILVRQRMVQNALATKAWLNHIFVENFANVPILLGLLRIVARFGYLEVYPEGQTMAVAALSHKNAQVRECGVRAFESWETLESLHILENLRVSTNWLQAYIDEVVADLRKQYNVCVCQED